MSNNKHISHTAAPMGMPVTEAVRPEDDEGLGFITGYRDLREFDRAKRHSNRVKLLKLLLPGLGVFVIAALVGSLFSRNSSTSGIDLGSISLSNGNLVMENPVLNGTDSKKRPYHLAADKATQNANNPTLVKLDRIKAKVPIDSGETADIIAGNGEYDSEAKTLYLGGTVSVTIANGMEIQLEDADLDIEAGRLATDNPVVVKSKEADISSEGLVVENNGDLIVFDRNVRMTLYPAQVRSNAESENQ